MICFNGVFEASLRADMIIAVSEYSKRHFLEVFPHYPTERIQVVYEASRFSLTDDVDEKAGQAWAFG